MPGDKRMWCIVMFDLPVKTETERKEATKFRNYLLDSGFSRVQYSVYVQYLPLGAQLAKIAKDIKAKLPHEGEVRIVPLTDKQWSNAFRFSNASPKKVEKTPEQLEIF
ncbi:CRISPR-associated endonuclease Cas2 [Corynebacterium lactis]|uniref:CRISPR-associated endoribonuclease Cas2 n=1 Tax=Corynebacterium lactis RW2-5 TaxID=1408189 RepID=A0A0K2GXA3_9CORY|nr:CRISPR-associated endonuclease Cas2 [Corynebacterium lactis]ALA66410.1 CRISPR-associated protein Cas2 [Corynebacterium lactis RW2-5]